MHYILYFSISLKLILDLSWNHIGETGAVLLLKSLKNNNTLITLNIQGNNILDETTEMISKLKLYIYFFLFRVNCII